MPSPSRVALFTVGGVVLAGAIGSAAFTGIVLLSAHDDKAHTQFTLTADTLVIESDGGGVKLVPGEPGVVNVDRTTTHAIRGAKPKWSMAGDKLKLDTNCPMFFSVNCDGNYTVTVPAAVKVVTVRNNNGAIRAEGMHKDLNLTSDNGSITVRDSVGNLKMDSDNGSINVDRTWADRIEASSDNGSLKITLNNEPSWVKASSDNGSARLTLPQGDRVYKLKVDTDNGSKNTSGIKDSAASNFLLDVSSDNGSVRVNYGPFGVTEAPRQPS
ncbi:DUF4097 family beta strand repeat-containing protein [Yinghuangia soli]|uniref:DUF4097 family beta strand repeat-containing protein n=1 Tax=Yinghuangia soli TaxID=2908204 RepID=A0AA41Q1R2_9ACTN|nr:DUF4097 family beta strand repeat-containing protein [Yinghuangia soli]MCF2529923.1 DUF4097 family beta strand repeat-containing protein [Yinghuangia soli]